MTALTKLHARGAGFLAAEFIYKNDCLPLTTAELYVNVDFGKNENSRKTALNSAISTGWLTTSPRGDIYITPEAIAYFDSQVEKPAKSCAGEPAAVREPLVPVYSRPPLSKRFIPNARGTRDDVPAFSVREKMSFRTVSGGSV